MEIERALIFEFILVAVLMTVWFFRIVLSFEVTVFALADINFNAAVRASGNNFTEHLGAAIINLLLRRFFSQVLILWFNLNVYIFTFDLYNVYVIYVHVYK